MIRVGATGKEGLYLDLGAYYVLRLVGNIHYKAETCYL